MKQGHQLQIKWGTLQNLSDENTWVVGSESEERINLGNMKGFLDNSDDPYEVVSQIFKLDISHTKYLFFSSHAEVFPSWCDRRVTGKTKLRVMTVISLLKQSQSRNNVRKWVMWRANVVGVCQLLEVTTEAQNWRNEMCKW